MAEKFDIPEDEINKYLDTLKKKTSPVYFYIILIGLPIIFFVLLELGLRIFGYGFNYDQWETVVKGKLMLNQQIAKRYFYNTKTIPFSNQDVFDAEKKPNSFRVFVLGGSSAAGYPFSPLGSFSRYIRDRLKLLYPSSEIEVVNLSMTAINSYTIRDLFPGVLEQKPDLILIYAGHNEYYGALGVGSMESLGTSRQMVNLLLYLNRFKTVELLRNTIQWAMKLISSGDKPSGTLMSRMAKEQSIAFDTETYEDGIFQFEGNMRDVLNMAKEKNVPVILSTLTSNLKDRPPFISIKTDGFPTANTIYTEAKEELKAGNNKVADSLFRYAKDLDALRFRAPEKMNKVITLLSNEYKLPLVNVDSGFASISPDGIVGNNLMTDHLHPTLNGYLYLGKLFFKKMEQANLLPKSERADLSDEKQDSITIANFHFAKLDSIIGNYRIKLLKNDWPFISKEKKLSNSVLLNPQNKADSLAAEVLDDKVSWETAHRKLATHYLERKNLNGFLKEMDALISQYPVIVEYYDYVSNILIQLKDYKRAYKYLKQGYEIKPNAYKTKWLGTINLYNNKLSPAEKYLDESLKYDTKDPQIWYNLAGIYVKRHSYKKALELVNKALALESNYPEAVNLQKQLQNAVYGRINSN
ncbi:tetratricopeptide repeat protein [bacterium BMS3Abin03]|nr:tetratricopeptide repeat protein [bacterium BMS3Abin03]MCG6959406.1 tetratricopeptide repeat protein [bacterium BMS3Abin03]